MSPSESSHTELDPSSAPAGDACPSANDRAANDLFDDPRVVEVVQEYLSKLEQGLAPDRAAYLRRYPELSAAVEQCLAGLEMVRAVSSSSGSAAESRARAAVDRPASERPPSSLGDFQIVRELARGGMGVVYEATQLSLNRRVALKVLPFASTFDARQLQRFKNEAQAAALLHHTHIVPIYAVGCERGVHFYAMQLIEGQSLAVVIRQLRAANGLSPRRGVPASGLRGVPGGQRGDDKSAGDKSAGDKSAGDKSAGDKSAGSQPSGSRPALHGPESTHTFPQAALPQELPVEVSVAASFLGDKLRSTAGASAQITSGTPRGSEGYFRKIARLVVQAAEALDHAHQLGIVHRDIKPANLLVNTAGDLWVTDFGLAQFQTDTGLTRTGDLLGTFRYMSPEQAAGQKTALDHRTDIYSLGATFYELLTLEPVFDGETRQELLYQILHSEPRAPRSINRAIPAELETIVLKALGKTPGERYATAGELAADIGRYLAHQPILARPPTAIDRLRKWSRRHPSAVVASVVLLAFSVVGLLVSNGMIASEQRKTSEALAHEKELFRQARGAVDVLVEVSEEELGNDPGQQRTRRRLLQTALGFYEDFIDQRRGDPASRAELEVVSDKVNGMLQELRLLRRDMRVNLLKYEAVLDDLGLDADERLRLSELLKNWDDEQRQLFAEPPVTPDAGRRRFVELAEEHERVLGEMLTSRQIDRLGQIAVQRDGLNAFKEPEIVTSLDLSAGQRSAIRDIEQIMYDQVRKRWQTWQNDGGGGEHRGLHDEPGSRGHHKSDDMDRWRSEPVKPEVQQALASVTKLLNPDQLKRWHELTGKPVDQLEVMPWLSRLFHRGGPGRPPSGEPPHRAPREPPPPPAS